MNKITDDQKSQLVKYMLDNRTDTYGSYSDWATNKFGVEVNVRDCILLLVDFENGIGVDGKKTKGGIDGMDTLTDREKGVLIAHMRRENDHTWIQHVNWVFRVFDKIISAKECSDLYLQSIHEAAKI